MKYLFLFLFSVSFSGCSGCFGCGRENPIEQEVIRQVGNITATFPQTTDTLRDVKETPKSNEVRIVSVKPNTPDVLLIFDDEAIADEVKKAKPQAVVTTPEKKQEGKVTVETPTQQEKSFLDGITLKQILIGGLILLVIGGVFGLLRLFGVIRS